MVSVSRVMQREKLLASCAGYMQSLLFHPSVPVFAALRQAGFIFFLIGTLLFLTSVDLTAKTLPRNMFRQIREALCCIVRECPHCQHISKSLTHLEDCLKTILETSEIEHELNVLSFRSKQLQDAKTAIAPTWVCQLTNRFRFLPDRLDAYRKTLTAVSGSISRQRLYSLIAQFEQIEDKIDRACVKSSMRRSCLRHKLARSLKGDGQFEEAQHGMEYASFLLTSVAQQEKVMIERSTKKFDGVPRDLFLISVYNDLSKTVSLPILANHLGKLCDGYSACSTDTAWKYRSRKWKNLGRAALDRASLISSLRPTALLEQSLDMLALTKLASLNFLSIADPSHTAKDLWLADLSHTAKTLWMTGLENKEIVQCVSAFFTLVVLQPSMQDEHEHRGQCIRHLLQNTNALQEHAVDLALFNIAALHDYDMDCNLLENLLKQQNNGFATPVWFWTECLNQALKMGPGASLVYVHTTLSFLKDILKSEHDASERPGLVRILLENVSTVYLEGFLEEIKTSTVTQRIRLNNKLSIEIMHRWPEGQYDNHIRFPDQSRAHDQLHESEYDVRGNQVLCMGKGILRDMSQASNTTSTCI